MIVSIISFMLGFWFGWLMCAVFSINKPVYSRSKQRRYKYKNNNKVEYNTNTGCYEYKRYNNGYNRK